MKKIFVAVILAALCASAVFSQAILREVVGKVEYQLPGKAWENARAGFSLPKGALLSTGFRSSVVLELGPAKVLVKPLTRLTIEAIVVSAGNTQALLYLSSGRVSAEVTPSSGTVDFTVQSPTATASVRGTGFDFDGQTLIVHHGLVMFTSGTLQVRFVGEGESSVILPDGTVVSSAELNGGILIVTDGSSAGDAIPVQPPSYALVPIIIEVE